MGEPIGEEGKIKKCPKDYYCSPIYKFAYEEKEIDILPKNSTYILVEYLGSKVKEYVPLCCLNVPQTRKQATNLFEGIHEKFSGNVLVEKGLVDFKETTMLQKDKESGLLPFMLVAVGDAYKLDFVYECLHEMPAALKEYL